MKRIKERLKEIRFRLVVVYTGILFFFLVCVLIFVSIQNYRQYEKEEQQNIEYIANSVNMQIENYVNQANFILLDTISDRSFINILWEIREQGIEDKMQVYYWVRHLQDCIVTQSSTRMLYRLNVLTDQGFFASSKTDIVGSTSEVIPQLPWLDLAREKKGMMLLLGPHTDPWGTEHKTVISVVRQVRAPITELGFLEGQLEYEEVVNICRLARQYRITIMDAGGNLFYTNRETEELTQADIRLLTAGSRAENWKNPVTKTRELICISESELTGLKCLVSEEVSIAGMGMGVFLIMGVFAIIAAAVCSAAVIYLFIKRLTRPLLELKNVLEKTDLETLTDSGNHMISHSNINEINSLIYSFQRMNVRLQESVIRERNAYQTQMEARFHALQAQINPHFIHNILNVIVNMAYENHVEEIPKVCNRLSENIRYSTSTKEQTAPFRDELHFMENYLMLMKSRFEHKLEYSIRIEEGFDDMVRLPKLTLIPFVENAIYHPYYESRKAVIRLEIEVGGTDQEWFFRIQDNGNGFAPGQVENMYQKMEEYLDATRKDQPAGLAIGGMGIINTYVRLKLYLKEQVSLELKNAETGGAVVIIRGQKQNV